MGLTSHPMPLAKYFALRNSADNAFAAFPASTVDEANARGRMIALSLGLAGEWRVEEVDVCPENVPWFEEAYFALISQARGSTS